MKRSFAVRTKGFTLIELLVVIAIIALLAAILFPVFARARENARKSSCSNNLKQIGVGLLQYAQDYDEALPFFFYGATGNPSNPNGTLYKWMDAIYPYVKSEQIFNCPSATTNRYKYFKNLAAADDTQYGNYGINVMYRYDNSPRTPPTGRSGSGLSLSDLQDSAGTLWVGDIAPAAGRVAFGWSCLASISGGGCTSIQPATVLTTASSGDSIENLLARHLNTANVVFCDGHVKSQNLTQLAAQKLSNNTLTAFTIEKD